MSKPKNKVYLGKIVEITTEYICVVFYNFKSEEEEYHHFNRLGFTFNISLWDRLWLVIATGNQVKFKPHIITKTERRRDKIFLKKIRKEFYNNKKDDV